MFSTTFYDYNYHNSVLKKQNYHNSTKRASSLINLLSRLRETESARNDMYVHPNSDPITRIMQILYMASTFLTSITKVFSFMVEKKNRFNK